MRIISQKATWEGKIDGWEILKKIECCGRVCYKSEEKITMGSAIEFVKKIIKRGHHSVLEHVSLTARFICDRGVSHEIVRHRIASYSQESTRYCNYAKGGVADIGFIEPPGLDDAARSFWEQAMGECDDQYRNLIASGSSPQIARSVLPNSLKTEIIMTANLREWRHFFTLRTAKAAHPQMREVAQQLLRRIREAIPVIFDDVGELECVRGESK